MLKSLQAVFRSEGLRGLYKGWWPTLLRDVPFSALYWHSFERIRWPLRDALETYMPPHGDGRQNSSALRMADFGAGALGGLVSAVMTHPFDVVKTRKQIGKLSHGCSNMCRLPYLFLFFSNRPQLTTDTSDDRAESSRLIGMLRQEGWRSLTRGLWLRLATVIPGGAIMVTVYEAVKDRTGHL
jgi:solute carrier family 25 protein 39/40